jgi:hypothetical protein
MARFGNTNIILHCKFYYYYYIEFECVFSFVWNGMLCTRYIIVFSLENSFHIVLSGEIYIVPLPLAQAPYLTRQHYRRTVSWGVDNNRITWTLTQLYCANINTNENKVLSPPQPQEYKYYIVFVKKQTNTYRYRLVTLKSTWFALLQLFIQVSICL